MHTGSALTAQEDVVSFANMAVNPQPLDVLTEEGSLETVSICLYGQ